MADGAERGYDVDTILRRRRGGRPPVGSAAASVESVRLDPELKRALMIRSGVDARPVVLALVEDTIGSLASLLLAAGIAAAQQGRLHVAHISSPRVWWGGTAGMPVRPTCWPRRIVPLSGLYWPVPAAVSCRARRHSWTDGHTPARSGKRS